MALNAHMAPSGSVSAAAVTHASSAASLAIVPPKPAPVLETPGGRGRPAGGRGERCLLGSCHSSRFDAGPTVALTAAPSIVASRSTSLVPLISEIPAPGDASSTSGISNRKGGTQRSIELLVPFGFRSSAQGAAPCRELRKPGLACSTVAPLECGLRTASPVERRDAMRMMLLAAAACVALAFAHTAARADGAWCLRLPGLHQLRFLHPRAVYGQCVGHGGSCERNLNRGVLGHPRAQAAQQLAAAPDLLEFTQRPVSDVRIISQHPLLRTSETKDTSKS